MIKAGVMTTHLLITPTVHKKYVNKSVYTHDLDNCNIIYNIVYNIAYNIVYNIVCNIVYNILYNIICNIAYNIVCDIAYNIVHVYNNVYKVYTNCQIAYNPFLLMQLIT